MRAIIQVNTEIITKHSKKPTGADATTNQVGNMPGGALRAINGYIAPAQIAKVSFETYGGGARRAFAATASRRPCADHGTLKKSAMAIWSHKPRPDVR